MTVCILSFSDLDCDECTIRSLPFGEAEQARLLGICNEARKKSSLGALMALQAIAAAPFLILRTPEGKPYFDAPDAPAFSLSHTDTLSVAVRTDPHEGAVGIDVEDIRPCPHATRVAERFFTARERDCLAQMPTDETFLTLWTAKEAIAKMSGQGLASALSAPPTNGYTKHFRLTANGTAAILCIASEQPIAAIEWRCPPTIQISEI